MFDHVQISDDVVEVTAGNGTQVCIKATQYLKTMKTRAVMAYRLTLTASRSLASEEDGTQRSGEVRDGTCQPYNHSRLRNRLEDVASDLQLFNQTRSVL